MHIIGADFHVCQKIWMGNFPAKWSPASTVGAFAYLHAEHSQGKLQIIEHFLLPAGLPLAPEGATWTTTAGRPSIMVPE